MEIICSRNEKETQKAGLNLGNKLLPGDVVALRGSLGAGKTIFAKGLALSLDINEEITSPTFTIISEYHGRLPMYHMDLYRISSQEEFTWLGIEEMLYGDGICVIEWSERVENALPDHSITVKIDITDTETRVISLGYLKSNIRNIRGNRNN